MILISCISCISSPYLCRPSWETTFSNIAYSWSLSPNIILFLFFFQILLKSVQRSQDSPSSDGQDKGDFWTSKTRSKIEMPKVGDLFLQISQICKSPLFYRRVVTPTLHSGKYDSSIPTQQTRGVQPMLCQWWASAVGGGPTLKQHLLNSSCLLGRTKSNSPSAVLHITVLLSNDFFFFCISLASQQTQNICITFVQRGPTSTTSGRVVQMLYKYFGKRTYLVDNVRVAAPTYKWS